LKTSRSAETVIKIVIKQNPMKVRVSPQFEPCGWYEAHDEKGAVDVGNVDAFETKAWVIQGVG